MKKIFIALFVLLLLNMVACQSKSPDSDDENGTGNKPDVAKVLDVEFDFEVKELEPGEYKLKANVFPSTANNDVSFEIAGYHRGILIDGDRLIITADALHLTIFNIVVYSNMDHTKRDVIELIVSNKIDEVIEINTEDELRAIGKNQESLNKSYILVNDIVLVKPWIPLGQADFEDDEGQIITGTYFGGTLNGNGYKISNIEINNGTYNVGFIAQIGQNGVLENIELEGSVEARGWSGGIAGINLGTIQNVISKIDVKVSGVSAGALVGVNRGTIQYVYSIGIVTSGLDNNEPRSTGLVAANEGSLIEVYGNKDLMTTNNYIAFEPTTDNQFMLDTAAMNDLTTWLNFDSNIWNLVNGEFPRLKKPLV